MIARIGSVIGGTMATTIPKAIGLASTKDSMLHQGFDDCDYTQASHLTNWVRSTSF